MKEYPNYYAIIPANVRYDDRLKANEKLLYGEITALTNKTGKCYATNAYFSKLYKVSKTSISKWIKNLIKYGYVKSELIYKEGSKEILNRYITIINHPVEEKLHTPIEEKLKDNNTSSNNTSINNKEKIKKDIFSDFDISQNLKTHINNFFKYRQEIKKPYKSEMSKKALIKRLSKHPENVAIKMLAQSIENGWQGVFDIKEEKSEKKRYKKL